MPKTKSSSTLKHELERGIASGRCAYCRRPAEPERPLTREHVIPRARGGRRNDVRIIVPACARCNTRRGCQALALFLILRPRRISAFLDHLDSLSPESLQQIDLRVFGELYAAVWMLGECADRGQAWREQLRRMTGGRTLHRRRYAARRAVREVGGRLEQRRGRPDWRGEPIAAREVTGGLAAQLEESLETLSLRIWRLLALVWSVSTEEVRQEISRELQMRRMPKEREEADDDSVLPLDGYKRRRHRRMRVDRRRGRAA